MKFVKALLVLAAVVAMAVVPMSASGKGAEETKIKLTDEGDVTGKVKSNDPGCVDGRKVTIMQKKPGKDKKHGSDNTDDDGSFDFGNPGLSDGTYYVKAGAIMGCLAGKSKTFSIA